VRQVEREVGLPGQVVEQPPGQVEDRVQGVVEAECGEEEQRGAPGSQARREGGDRRHPVGDVVDHRQAEEPEQEPLVLARRRTVVDRVESGDVAQRDDDPGKHREPECQLPDHRTSLWDVAGDWPAARTACSNLGQ
jgi:hypothetical protein